MTRTVQDRSTELAIGLQESEEREITADDVLTFARLSGDVNPLHVDERYAAGTTFGRRVVHGAFQVALASGLLGTRLPGARVLLGSVTARFPAPLFFPCRVVVSGVVTAWNPDTRAGQLRVTIQESATRNVSAEIGLGFTLHGEASSSRSAHAPAAARHVGTRPLVAVTGAAGDVGAAIVADLARDHDVLALVNERGLPECARSPSVREEKLDLVQPNLASRLAALAQGQRLFGIVHAAWPGAPRGGLLEAGPDLIQAQLRFGSDICVALARALFDNAGPEGGRMVAISSTAGSLDPQLSQAAYALGKACLDQTVHLLSPELARRRITVNAVAPSFMRAGMNRNADERLASRAAAGVPSGRLCTPQDVAGAVRFLLSEQASFISGRVLPLTGGKL